jgi:hypothetical protein
LIECLDKLLPSITSLINSSLISGTFPESFKKALVSPLLKKPTLDANVLKNYRPISNLTFISKIIEKLVHAQLCDYLVANSLFNPFQSAYRPGHSCETALLRIVNDLLLSLDERKVSILTLLDLSAAFDTIDHSILLHRLQHDFGICDTALKWFSSYLTGRTQSVVVGGHMSDPDLICFGVPQGSVLGPLLFVLYTSPLSSIIQKHSVHHHSFADDTQLHKSAYISEIPELINVMKQCTDDVKSWMTANKLKLNDDKTEAMLISSSKMASKVSHCSSIVIGTSNISFSASVRDLGFHLDCHLEMKAHVQNVIKTANFELRKIGSIRCYLTTHATATLVSSLVLSRLDYCNSLLYGCHDYLIDKLQRIQNNCARMVLRIPKRSHMTTHLIFLHWLPISSRIDYKISSICFNCIQGTAPGYLKQLIPLRETAYSYNTRSTSDKTAIRDRPAKSQKTLGDRCFSYAAPSVWNSLPPKIRGSASPASFKSSLKTHLFRSAF